ncbi:RHS repeat-associated core domain-containing protein [Streptomyces sp. NPDC048297]|uniref:RHS repeat-associated core domain-containing protein n=1 Tax=Streptomyces sp. NPDC048297 TaxID=3365531 RepID=UPI0037184D66
MRSALAAPGGSWYASGDRAARDPIERSYKPCGDEGVKDASGNKVGDLCWAYDNATISFDGHSGELIATGANSFRIKGDDGTKVDRIYGDSTNVRANGAHNDEYWRMTTTDGTRYYFGYNRLTGWATGNPTTNSAWTVPVYGNDSGEQCHAATFADSWCQQGWRWNLDYAIDVHGNAIAYFYDKETNYYGRNLTATDETVYDRGGSINRIEYGLKLSTTYSAKALAKVDFTTAERCIPQTGVTCNASSIDTQSSYWYDTPWDLNCKSGASCYAASPTFFTRKRLTGVSTSTLQSDGTYAPVDSWALDHQWGMADIDYQLELASIQHTGKAATPDITLPKVTFGYDQRTNRLKIDGDDTSPFIKERLATIDDEAGGQTDVEYSTAACDASNLPTPETNTTRCFPQYYTKSGDSDPTLQWFNKYVVDAVTQTDRTGGAPDQVTRYTYLDGAAWHYDDDDGLTKEKYKTWSTFRGYGHVRVQTGGQAGMKSQSEHYFLRGMDGDKASPSGGTKSVPPVSDDNGGTITDADPLVGFEYKTEDYSGPGGNVLDKNVSTPWFHQTATVTRSWGTVTANLTGTLHTYTWTSLDDGAGFKWRQTYVSYAHEDTAGRVTTVNDTRDTSTSADNRCTRTTYADNTSKWILNRPSRIETVATACPTAPDRSKAVLSDVRTAYDGQDYGVAPTTGDATHLATLKSHDGTTATYLESGVTYDSYGRPLATTDITGNVTATETTAPVRTARSDGRTATTVYSPSTGFPTTTTVTTPPAKAGDSTTAQTTTTTTTYEPVRGLPLTVVDTNNKRTDTTYDALGRTLKVWLPNRSKANSQTPNYAFSYTITDGQAVAVGTTTLAGTGTLTSYTLYDGFLRPRQAQAPGPSGGRLVSDTFYDERGLVPKAFAPYYNNQSGPSTGLLSLTDATGVETQTWNTYDGLGRITTAKQVAGSGDGGQVLSTSTTVYGGDRTTVTPPQGGTPITTVTDARGQTTELDQYHASTPTGAYDKTLYGYTPAGQLDKITDPAGNVWSYAYDQDGNQKTATDPDKGTTTSVYDDRGQLLSTTDSRSKKITHVYDNLGREIETHDGDATGPLLTAHVWDPTGYKGQLASATRYIGGATGYAYTTSYGLFDNLYRPQRTTVTIPSSEGDLAGSYASTVAYNADSTIQSIGYPKTGALAAEAVTPSYDEVLRPKTLTGSGGNTYVTDTAYSYTGKPLQYTYQAAGAKFTQVTNTYEWGTQRLSNSRVDRQDINGTDKSATYHYDQAGNITSVADVSRDGTDNQCFTYDYLGRLTEAWAQGSTTCAAAPAASALGGPAPYWQSYAYDLAGNRTSETRHDPSGDSAQDLKHTFTYPDPGASHPHFPSQVTTTGPNGTAVDSYTPPDNTGNTQTRTVVANKQTLTWDTEGHLAAVSADDGNGGTKTANYIYDADGNRLIADTDSGTTLFLSGTEITLGIGSTTQKGTRYYNLGDGGQAVRTDDGKLSFLIGDHQGTSQLAINSSDLSMQQRRSTPFGAQRGTAPTSWPGDKGYVGGTNDATTGLTHLGARDYDPATGRFLSVDPLMDPTNPQSLNGYSYAENNPVTLSDPTGLCPVDLCGGGEGKGGATNGEVTKVAKSSPAYQPLPYDVTLPGTGKRQIFPGVFIPDHFKGWQKVRDRFYHYWLGTMNTNGSTPQYLLDPDNPNQHAQVELWLWNSCRGGKACPKGTTSSFMQVVAGGLFAFGWGEGAGARGRSGGIRTRAGGVRLKRPCSFTPSTRVLMRGRKSKPIGKIKAGDEVESADPATGRHQGSRTVTATHIHHDDDLVDLTLQTGHHHFSILHTTSRHPFWDDTRHTWVPAGQLTPGHNLETATDHHVRVVSVRTRPGAADMYNLTVKELHTYYVLAGSTPILVHNACGDPAHAADCYCNWGEPVIPRPNAAAKVDEFTLHATQRLEQRGVSAEDAQAVLGREPFSYNHDDQWKLGYHDPRSKVFVAKTVDGNVNTVMTNVDQAYINRLQGGR